MRANHKLYVKPFSLGMVRHRKEIAKIKFTPIVFIVIHPSIGHVVEEGVTNIYYGFMFSIRSICFKNKKVPKENNIMQV